MKPQYWRIGASLDAQHRVALLETFNPAFPNVHANGVTYAYRTLSSFVYPQELLECHIYGYHIGDGHDALLVTIDGNKTRPDGKLFHITLSTEDGVPPAQAGQIDRANIQTFTFKLGVPWPPFIRLTGPMILGPGMRFPVHFQRHMLRPGRVERMVLV